MQVSNTSLVNANRAIQPSCFLLSSSVRIFVSWNEEMYRKIMGQEGRSMPEEEAKETAKAVALSALKYGDLSNQASKDYIFDIDRFTSSEGDTGPLSVPMCVILL